MANKFEWEEGDVTYTPPPEDNDDVADEIEKIDKILEEAGEDPASFDDSLDGTVGTLYVSRKVLNSREIYNWAKASGVQDLMPADGLHVTLIYSRAPVDWMQFGEAFNEEITIGAGGPRVIQTFGGDNPVIVLEFASGQLQWRHREFVEGGASYDWDSYRPHITVGRGEIPEGMTPYTGRIVLGPEIFEEVRE